MAMQDTQPDVKISKALRQLKVEYTSIRDEDRRTVRTTSYSRGPSIKLKGRWLEEMIFVTDTPVSWTIDHRQLVIHLLINLQLDKNLGLLGSAF